MRISALAFILTLMTASAAPGLTQQRPVGVFDGNTDVGAVKHPGSATYNPATEEYTIRGSGTNMWFGTDEFHFVWKRMKGDFLLNTGTRFVGKGVDPHRKAGWIIRRSLDPNSPHVTAVVHGDGLTALQFRRAPGANTEEVRSPMTGADVLQLERQGNRFVMSVAKFGDTLVANQVADIDLGDEVYVGLFVSAHNPDVVEQAVFRNVRVTVPAKPNFVPYRDYIGSNLEVLNVATGDRRVVHRLPTQMEAPNWTTDGKALIYNSRGRLYRFDLASRTPTEINTGFATSNNNDHVLSFDGKMLGISHHSREDGGKSIVYTVPVTGGTPRRVTPLGPSYLHGWSPDGRWLLYTGQRNDELDIYRISVNGGQEIRLTTAKGVDDGSEYTPDGRWIYFNSSRSGTMQIWRMRPDGSRQEQVTNDSWNNWFPHISPDGRWIAFLSYGRDVKPDDHPYYKHVYLRLMPAAGGPARVIAYVYGGQGTINVPSWSPDSRQLAFVSNTAGN